MRVFEINAEDARRVEKTDRYSAEIDDIFDK